MERRELDKQTPGQTDQPGETGSASGTDTSPQLLSPGHRRVPARPARHRLRRQRPRPRLRSWCGLITVSMAIKGENSTNPAVCKHRSLPAAPAQSGGCVHTRVTARGWHRRHLRVTRTSTTRIPRHACPAPGPGEHGRAHAVTRVPVRHVPPNTRVLARVQGGAAGAPGAAQRPLPARPEQTPR